MHDDGCKVLVAGSTMIVMCSGDMEARWHEHLARQSELEWEDHQVEMAHEANETLRAREPEMWEAREATDPYWPPPEVDDIERIEPEVVHWPDAPNSAFFHDFAVPSTGGPSFG